jgi:hypothetical protein
MRRGQKVVVKINEISEFAKDMMSAFQKFNEATVSKWDKNSQRVMVSWPGCEPMWFDINEVEKA